MQRRTFNKLLGASAAAAALGRFGLARADEPFKAGFVYVGPVADFGWSHQHDLGRQAAQKAIGDKLKTTSVESVMEGPDSERVIRELATGGNGIIFTTSFGFMNPTIKVAKQFPVVKFEHCTGYKRAVNVATYNIRFYEGRYIQGVIAGKVSKSGVVGYIGSVPIPEVVMGMNAFIQGMRTVNPQGKIKLVWINGWYDPGKESDAAKALIDQGADIIAQHTDSAAPLQVAEQRGVHGFGQASDMITRAQGAAHLLDRPLGRLLYPAHPGGHGRQLGDPGHLGRPQDRHAAYGALDQHARRRRPGRSGRGRRNQERQHRDLQGTDQRPGWQDQGSRRRPADRRRYPRHELARRGNRGNPAAVRAAPSEH